MYDDIFRKYKLNQMKADDIQHKICQLTEKQEEEQKEFEEEFVSLKKEMKKAKQHSLEKKYFRQKKEEIENLDDANLLK